MNYWISDGLEGRWLVWVNWHGMYALPGLELRAHRFPHCLLHTMIMKALLLLDMFIWLQALDEADTLM